MRIENDLGDVINIDNEEHIKKIKKHLKDGDHSAIDDIIDRIEGVKFKAEDGAVSTGNEETENKEDDKKFQETQFDFDKKIKIGDEEVSVGEVYNLVKDERGLTGTSMTDYLDATIRRGRFPMADQDYALNEIKKRRGNEDADNRDAGEKTRDFIQGKDSI